MNKYLAWLPLLMIAGVFTLKPIKEAREEKPLNRSISFAVYKSNAYTSAAYNNTSAEVHIIVEKVTTSGKHTIVWDKKLDSKSLSQYPSVKNALKQNITIPNVNQKKEYLAVHYTLTYNSKGSELQMWESTIVKENNSEKVEIKI
jgi:hypothetical protein